VDTEWIWTCRGLDKFIDCISTAFLTRPSLMCTSCHHHVIIMSWHHVYWSIAHTGCKLTMTSLPPGHTICPTSKNRITEIPRRDMTAMGVDGGPFGPMWSSDVWSEVIGHANDVSKMSSSDVWIWWSESHITNIIPSTWTRNPRNTVRTYIYSDSFASREKPKSSPGTRETLPDRCPPTYNVGQTSG